MPVEEQKALVRRYIEDVWNAGDVAALRRYVAPEVVLHGLAPGPIRGVAGVEQSFAALRSVFPDLTVAIDDRVGEDGRVAVRYTMRGTHRGALVGAVGELPPTGRAIAVGGINVVHVAGGRMVAGWAQLDTLGMLQQLGAMPRSGEAEPPGWCRMPPAGATSAGADPTATKSVARRFIDEFINGGTSAIVGDVVAADYVYCAPGIEVSGPQGIENVVAMLRRAFPDWRETLEEPIAEGDKAVFRVTGRGTHAGPFFGIPPTGRRVTMGGIDLVRVAGGKLVRHWAVFDRLDMMRQLGAGPTAEPPRA